MNMPFFRMASPNGAREKGLTFSSFHHTLINLARRDGYKDRVRVHGIRGGVANKVDGMYENLKIKISDKFF